MLNEIYKNRLKNLQKLMREHDFKYLSVIAGKDLKYLTGMDFHLSERPVILIIPYDAEPVVIYPDFEQEKVRSSSMDFLQFSYSEDAESLNNACYSALNVIEKGKMQIGVSPQSMRFFEMNLLKHTNVNLEFLSAEMVFKKIYIQKSADEIEKIKRAVKIAEVALRSTLPYIKIGASEREIANHLVIHLLSEGSDPELPFNPIVASGPNSANPHAVPGSRKFQQGDLVIMDWGARVEGYVSDITRTYSLGKIDDELRNAYDVVMQANHYARKKVKPGTTASSVDKAAREVIEKEGFGEYFTHRTGHGIGLEAHEHPYISQTSTAELKSGMVFTIEPGIYLPGKGGIRIEDNVFVSDTNSKTLTNLPRELQIL